MDKIAILDFGGQTTQLIGRRLREGGFDSEIFPGDISLEKTSLDHFKGIILSGSPYSVYEEGSPLPDPALFQLGKPLLGICYGFQLMTQFLGGRVEGLAQREYGRTALNYEGEPLLFQAVPRGFLSWMSHGDSIAQEAQGFKVIARTDNHPAAAHDPVRNYWGIQFHPEISHCEFGNQILWNFATLICGMEPEWSLSRYLEESGRELSARVGQRKVLLLISGGVDSTVAGGMLLKVLDPDQVYLMYVDTGLMRKNESEEVAHNLKKLGARHLHLIQAQDRFLGPLKGISDPETKRKIIGDLFIQVQEEETARLDLGEDYFLAQGTLYTDLIESGQGVGKKAKVIKSHHNVGTPLVMAKREKGLVIEPLSRLYKDEVRQLGTMLGISDDIVHRHPFPGPGLAIRILGEVTKEKCDLLREADWIYIQELKKRGLYPQIWQAFSVLLPVRSVGVTGDAREYGWVLALRAVTSQDGMSADVFDFPTKDLLEISNTITNSVKDIGRVVYDISSKPPSTIEWE